MLYDFSNSLGKFSFIFSYLLFQILELLKGKKAAEKWGATENEINTESQDQNDDEVYPNSSAELHLSLAMLDVDDDSTSFSSMEQSSNLSMEEL